MEEAWADRKGNTDERKTETPGATGTGKEENVRPDPQSPVTG
jgi:hypothetical protein